MKIGVLFDLDGTLLDTLEDLTDATNYALRQFGYPERTVEEVRSFVGNGVGVLIRKATDEADNWEQVLSVFRPYYDAHCRVKTAPYPGVVEALDKVRGNYPVAVVSNKPDSAVKELCRDFFHGVYGVGETENCPRKPAPDMVRKAMAAIGADCCIYVGDSEVDLLTAKNAGMPCISVLWGFRDRELLERQGASRFCDNAEKLPDMIDKVIGEYYGK